MRPLSGASPANSGSSTAVGRWIWWVMGARQLGVGLGGTGRRRERQSSTAYTTREKRSLIWLAGAACGIFQVLQLSLTLKDLSASRYAYCSAILPWLQGAVSQHWTNSSARTGLSVLHALDNLFASTGVSTSGIHAIMSTCISCRSLYCSMMKCLGCSLTCVL